MEKSPLFRRGGNGLHGKGLVPLRQTTPKQPPWLPISFNMVTSLTRGRGDAFKSNPAQVRTLANDRPVLRMRQISHDTYPKMTHMVPKKSVNGKLIQKVG